MKGKSKTRIINANPAFYLGTLRQAMKDDPSGETARKLAEAGRGILHAAPGVDLPKIEVRVKGYGTKLSPVDTRLYEIMRAAGASKEELLELTTKPDPGKTSAINLAARKRPINNSWKVERSRYRDFLETQHRSGGQFSRPKHGATTFIRLVLKIKATDARHSLLVKTLQKVWDEFRKNHNLRSL